MLDAKWGPTVKKSKKKAKLKWRCRKTKTSLLKVEVEPDHPADIFQMLNLSRRSK